MGTVEPFKYEDTEKPWGRCIPVAVNQICQFDRLEIKAGGYSSLHFHRKKINQFVVESGRLQIYSLDGDQISVTTLRPGDGTILDAGSRNTHQFCAPVDCLLHEFYWQVPEEAPIEREEIVRLTPNGCGDFTAPTVEQVLKLLADAGEREMFVI